VYFHLLEVKSSHNILERGKRYEGEAASASVCQSRNHTLRGRSDIDIAWSYVSSAPVLLGREDGRSREV